MPRQVKHDRTHRIASESVDLVGLVHYLNQRKGDSGYRADEDRGRAKVSEIVRLLQQLYSHELQWRVRNPSEFGSLMPWPITKLQIELNDVLRRHKGIRQIFDFDNHLHSRWTPAIPCPADLKPFYYTNLAMDLADSRVLPRLQVCGCGKYFVAKSNLTRFCSSACRIQFWELSEERKEQKRRKAREYYMLHKAGIVRSHGKTKGSK